MRNYVLKFGLIAGAILSVMMLITMPMMDQIGMEYGMVLGYSTMLIAGLMTYFGVRAYRDNVLGGRISFGKAFQTGMLITLVSTVCYVATWEFLYYRVMPDFAENYGAHVLEKAKADGATEAELATQREEMAKFAESYKNPLVNIAYTLLEPLPVGLLMTLVSAGVLSRKRRQGITEGGLASTT